jgi:hypothetical protein
MTKHVKSDAGLLAVIIAALIGLMLWAAAGCATHDTSRIMPPMPLVSKSVNQPTTPPAPAPTILTLTWKPNYCDETMLLNEVTKVIASTDMVNWQLIFTGHTNRFTVTNSGRQMFFKVANEI